MQPKQIKHLLHLPQLVPANLDFEKDEVLTPEEIDSILHEARELKRAEYRIIEYNRKLREEQKEISVSSAKFYDWIIWKATNNAPEEGGIKDFKLTLEEENLYKMLCMYFTKDERFQDYKDPFGRPYSLHKALWIVGNWGSGKTTLMELFRFNPLAPYHVVSCETIAEIFKETGVVGKYDTLESICFDDLGKDMRDGVAPMHMGTRKNVMASIFAKIYKNNKKKEFRAHVTTNLSTEEAVILYGGDITDRFREMYNIISLESIQSKRK